MARLKRSLHKAMAAAEMVMIFLAAIVVLLLIFFGMKGYGAMQEKNRQHDMVLLINALQTDSSSLSGSYGSLSEKTYTLPSGVEEICFADLSHKEDIGNSPSYGLRPLVKDSVESGVADNVFLLDGKGEIVQSSSLGNVAIPHYPYLFCKQDSKGKFSLTWENRGKTMALANDDILTKEIMTSEGSMAFSTADGSLRIFVEEGTPVSGEAKLSFRLAAPSSPGAVTESLEFLSTSSFCDDQTLDTSGDHPIPYKDGKKVGGQGLRMEFLLPPSKKCETGQENTLVFYYVDDDAPTSYQGECSEHRITFWICDI